jgi:starvation-inducible DNA-binding protein
MAAPGSALPEFPAGFHDLGHVTALAERYAAVANSIRKAIDKCAELGDADSADLLTGISRELDKQLWFLEAHTKREG